MNSAKFSREPVIWIGAIVAILMLVQDYMTIGITMESLDAALVAVAAVIGRHYVSPVDKR